MFMGLLILYATSEPFRLQVVVGDAQGFVQLFSMKRGELQLGFKTVPGKAITRVELGGALGG